MNARTDWIEIPGWGGILRAASRFMPSPPRGGCLLLVLSLYLLAPAKASGQARIIALSPDRGPAGGGTLVTIQVEGGVALGPMEVTFGNRPAREAWRTGFSTLQVVTPPGEPGPVPVRVVSRFWGIRTDPAAFTYVPQAPHVVRVDPPSVPAGSEASVLQVEGEHFTGTCQLLLGEIPVPTTFVSPRRLQARVPAPLLAKAGSVNVRVTDTAAGGGTSNVLSLNVVSPPQPVAPLPQVTGVEAPPLKVGSPATSLTVRGREFRPDSLVYLGGIALATQYRTGGELSAVVPPELLAKPGELPVTVVTPGPGGGASNPVPVTVQPPLAGRFVVFTSSRRGGRNHIFLLDRETGRLDLLEEANSLNGSDGYPSISADGRFIVFQSDRNRGQADVFLFDRGTRRLDPLPEMNHPTAFDDFPHISADGRFVVFESDRVNRRPKVFLFDRSTRSLSEVSQANEATADDGLPAISN